MAAIETLIENTREAETPYRLLIVDDDSTIRLNLKDYLLFYHQAPYTLEIDEASTAEEAINRLQSSPYDLVISDINLPDKDGFNILKEAVLYNPKIKKALITAYELNNYMEMAKHDQVYNIITKTAPFNFSELSLVVDNLLLPENAFGLEKYLEPEAQIERLELQSSDDIMMAHGCLKDFFKSHGLDDIDALAIVMIEAITNAVYHAPRQADGSQCYYKGEVIEQLPPQHRVVITYGVDSEKLGISIRDQGGSITADDIMYWLERNISGNSLLDTHGRGVFLIHRLVDRVVINLARGKQTELVMMHYLHEHSSENKPLYINEVL